MTGQPDVYIGSISRRWKKEAMRNPAPVTIVSPYLTSKSAERILSIASSPTVITLFDINVFSSGASSIGTLRRLLAMGYDLRHANNLHAKIYFGPSFVSIGSQNLTSAGAGRKMEASVALSDKRSIKLVEKAVADWTETADTISAEMINAMEKKVRPLRRKFLALKLQMRLAEEEFQEEEKLLAEKQRTQEREMAERLNEEARKEEERKRAAFLAHEEAVRKQAALNNYLRKTVHFDLIPVRLTQMRANDSHGRFDHDYWTMSVLHPQKHDMTKWLFSGKEFRLRHGDVPVDVEKLR